MKERYVVISEEILRQAEHVMLFTHRDPYNSFTEILETSKKFSEAGLTPIFVFDKVEGSLECFAKEYYVLN